LIVGSRVSLRLVRESDLEALYGHLANLAGRGEYFPTGLMGEARLNSAFAQNSLWDEEEGMLLMVTADDEIVGEIEFFPITHYLQGYELSYQVFGPEHSGKGYSTEAVRLLTDYLFGRKRVNRIQLNIHPGNRPSKRVAEKSGFTFEGIMRQCWFHQGDFHDLEIWSQIRSEWTASKSANSSGS
jgi:[ribosomal protein S5]-alanine N-acetyltransferase